MHWQCWLGIRRASPLVSEVHLVGKNSASATVEYFLGNLWTVNRWSRQSWRKVKAFAFSRATSAHRAVPVSIFTALHVMQPRYCDEISVCPSVRPSVRLSVTRVDCDKTEERLVQIYIPYERTFILVFWEDRMVGGGDPFYLKFWVNRPPLERNRRFSTNNRS